MKTGIGWASASGQVKNEHTQGQSKIILVHVLLSFSSRDFDKICLPHVFFYLCYVWTEIPTNYKKVSAKIHTLHVNKGHMYNENQQCLLYESAKMDCLKFCQFIKREKVNNRNKARSRGKNAEGNRYKVILESLHKVKYSRGYQQIYPMGKCDVRNLLR